jgi:HK97 family phage portal protein
MGLISAAQHGVNAAWRAWHSFDRKAVEFSPAFQEFLLTGGGSQSKAGAAVTVESALGQAVVIACGRVLSEGVAQMPCRLYRERPDGGKEIATDHPLHWLLYRRPNDWMTSYELRETLTWHAVLTGDGFAFINRVGREIAELIPILPAHVTINQAPNYEITYTIRVPQKEIGTYARSQILHLRGPSWNGYTGLAMVRQAREAIGLAIATEETHARLHANGARTGGLISTEQTLGRDDVAAIRRAWQESQTADNAFKTAILDKGFKYAQLGMTGVDNQHIETRKFQIEEVCRAMRVFPLMVMQADKASTFASAEQFFLAHVIHSLGPWVERWEQAISRDCLTMEDVKSGLFPKFGMQALLRGDAKARSEFYTKLYNIGAINPNEVRSLEDLNPYEGGDSYRVPLNMEDPADPDGDKETDDAAA